MFCKYCGTAMSEDARFCPSCGNKTKDTRILTPEDNKPTMGLANVSGKGFFGEVVRSAHESEKTTKTALILAVLFGLFGGHSFYTGHLNKGITKIIASVFGLTFPFGFLMNIPALGWVQVAALLGSAVWLIIDIIMIATGDYTDSEDMKLFKNY